MTGEFPLQNLIFPSGLGYDKHNNKVQTSETNEFLALIHLLSTEIDEIKNGDSIKKDQISALVTPEGLNKTFKKTPKNTKNVYIQ